MGPSGASLAELAIQRGQRSSRVALPATRKTSVTRQLSQCYVIKCYISIFLFILKEGAQTFNHDRYQAQSGRMTSKSNQIRAKANEPCSQSHGARNCIGSLVLGR